MFIGFPDWEIQRNGLTETQSDVASLLCLLESGTYDPGALRPLEGVASNEH